MRKNFDFNDDNAKQAITQIFGLQSKIYPKTTESCPKWNTLPLLKRGIGIHHGGLVPLVKVVELLFQEQLRNVVCHGDFRYGDQHA